MGFLLNGTLVAQSPIGDPDNLIPLLAILLTFGTPIIWILTAHQRKMAELMHRGNQGVDNQEAARMRHEMADLRERMNHQTLMLDDIRARLEALPIAAPRAPEAPTNNLEERLRNG